MDDVSAVVKEVLARWLVPGYAPRVTCAWDITQGPCEEFAEEVVELLAERMPSVKARVCNSDEAASGIGREFNAYHAFVEAGGMYYDSVRPDGVRDPFMLPFLSSELRQQIALESLSDNVDEELDEDDASLDDASLDEEDSDGPGRPGFGP